MKKKNRIGTVFIYLIFIVLCLAILYPFLCVLSVSLSSAEDIKHYGFRVIPKHLEAISAKLIEIGCEVIEFDDAVRVVGKPVQRHTDIKTLPYPGFPTDMQPQMAVTLALANGTSMVTESIFENRFKYVDELARMGSHIKVEGNVAVIDGVAGFTGAQVNAPDLRAGAALVIAGLAAEGYTTVDEIGYIQRGYECFEEKLQALGAVIEKVDSEREVQKFKLRVG